MGGTNPTATYGLLDNTSQTATVYKAQIDANSVAAKRIVDRFAPHAQSSPNMTIALDAGNLFDGVTLTEVASQSTGTITAPSIHPRIDRVVIDNTSGALSVVAGTEAVSPTAPAIPVGKSPVAQILLQTSTTTITNAIITDERNFSGMSSGGFGSQSSLASAATCDLGSILGRNVLITGTTTITSFGSSASTLSPICLIQFSGALTLTHDGTALILPGAANIASANGDTATAEYLGSGNWRVRDYQRADGTPLVSLVTSVASKTGAVTLTKSDVGLSGVQNVDQTDASNLASGTVPTARLGSGSASSSTVLFGNNTWGTPSVPTTYGAVGTYVYAGSTASASSGGTLSGVSLTPTQSGTWRLMAANYTGTGTPTLWVRVV